MSILDFFASDMVSATIKRETPVYIDGVRQPESLTTITTLDVLYWEGAAATSLVSERFRDTTAAAISVPVGTDIQKNDQVTVQGKEYVARDPDNVGAADEHILVALEVLG